MSHKSLSNGSNANRTEIKLAYGSFNNYVKITWPFFDYLPTLTWTFFTLNVDKKKHFLTTYPPHLVHVVFERPLTEDDRFKAVAAKTI